MDLAREALTPRPGLPPGGPVGAVGLGWFLTPDGTVATTGGAGPGGAATLFTRPGDGGMCLVMTSRAAPLDGVVERASEAAGHDRSRPAQQAVRPGHRGGRAELHRPARARHRLPRPNGAGKTTTMRAVVGVAALDRGTVRWGGEPIGAAARSQIGYMPEERGLYPGMRVAEHLEYLGRLHGLSASAARSATAEWMDRLGLSGRAATKVEALSLGNQQRVQLAAALVHDPGLLVLDEPFSGLDPAGVDAMSEVLNERARAGVTLLFSSHQLDLVEHLCESVAIIHHGALVARGRVADLSLSGRLRVSVRVAGDDAGRWAQALAGPGTVETVEHGVVTVALADRDDAQTVLDHARAAGPVEQFGFVRRKLSEVFRDAVGADATAAHPAAAQPEGVDA